MRMTITIDERLVAAVMATYGTKVKREAIERALRDALRNERRRAALTDRGGVDLDRDQADIANLVEQAIADDEAAVNGIVVVEVQGYARSDAPALIERDFSAFHHLELDSAVILRAVEICTRLRDAGTPVPATDALIAASAISAGASLVHCDSHSRRSQRYVRWSFSAGRSRQDTISVSSLRNLRASR